MMSVTPERALQDIEENIECLRTEVINIEFRHGCAVGVLSTYFRWGVISLEQYKEFHRNIKEAHNRQEEPIFAGGKRP